MDALPQLIELLLRWRLSLSIALAIGIALLLSNTFVAFTAGYCISLVLLATGFGIFWQGRAEAGLGLTSAVPPTPISTPVACLGFFLVGFFWGGVAGYLFHSAVAAAIFLSAAVGAVGLWYRVLLKLHVSLRYLVAVTVSLLAGYGTLLSLPHLNAL